MSSSLRIDEDLITSGKFGSGKSSPASSRESSNERRGRQSSTRSLSRESSSEGISSRDSSLESKSKAKLDRDERRSYSQLNGTSSVKSDPKTKRGRRPKSLDLSNKSVVNGDDDKFKSPDPLTPCNVFVKRRKGRPKETPPTLVAEPAVITTVTTEVLDGTSVDYPNCDIEVETEEELETPKRKPGRPSRADVTKSDKPLVARKLVKPGKGFGLKRNMNKLGFRKLPKLTKMKPSVISFEPEVNSVAEVNAKTVKTEKNSVPNHSDNEPVVKRKPGRPPGAKNKPKTPLNILGRKKRKGDLIKTSLIKGKGKQGLKPKIGRNSRRPIVKKTKKVENSETKDKSLDTIVINSVSVQTEIDEDMFEDCIEENPSNGESPGIALDGSAEGHSPSNPEEVSKNLDEAINAVVFKAGNNLPLVNTKYKKTVVRVKHGVASLGKLKKMRDIVRKVRKKKILIQHKHLDGRTVDVLAPNDLRRKLHEKVLKNMLLTEKPSFPECTVKKVDEAKTELVDNVDMVKEDSAAFKTNVFYSQGEPKAQGVNERLVKAVVLKGRKQSIDMGEPKKFSDTESICSEISTTSLSSAKRLADKQIIVLGEEHNESDDSSIRTRQRFDIVPGKQRKRTLSGEFDLLDEKQLRKKRKLTELGIVEPDGVSDGSEDMVVEEVQKQTVKRSPKLKVRDRALVEKYGTTFKLKKAQMLRQSPFLTYKKRRKKGLKKNMKKVSPLKSPTVEIESKDAQNKYTLNPLAEASVLLSNSNTWVKPDEHRKSLFEQFDDYSGSSEELKVKSLKELCEQVVSVREASKACVKEVTKVGVKTLSEPEVVVNGIITDLLDQVVGICQPKTDIDYDVVGVSSYMTEENTFDIPYGLSVNVNGGFRGRGSGRRRTWKRRRAGQTRRKKLGPLPIARKMEPFQTKRASRGRKKTIGSTDRLVKSTARKTNLSVEPKTSDLLVTRTFELRQKISRSPLDNIALKQSLEETKYLKAEQQRAIRKESKLKLKLKLSSEDSMDSTQSEMSEVLTEQSIDVQVEEIVITLEELKKSCRPCSVVLVDFIKKLQSQTDPDDEGSEVDTSLDETTDIMGSESPECETSAINNDKSTAEVSAESNELSQSLVAEKADDEKVKVDVCESKPEVTAKEETVIETNEKPSETQVTEKADSVEGQKVSPFRVKKSDVKDAPKPSALKSEKPDNTENSIASIGESENTETVPILKPPLKMKRTGRKSLMYDREINVPKKLMMQEQQTARKTVPPLKIKVKGVKRKTYMVEPHPDSPVDTEADAKPKPDKKKKSKSGNKSESSDSEKLAKGHHHHKKRNKSPPKTDTMAKPDPLNQTNNNSPSKQAIKPTDAYEANFLQFIKDTNEPKEIVHTMSPFTVKNKIARTLPTPKPIKSEMNMNAMSMANIASLAMLRPALNPPTFVNAGLLGPNTFPDAGVKFLCILCNAEYMSQELISKHFAEVHPGTQFTFKPQADAPGDSERLAMAAQNQPPPAPILNNQTPATRYVSVIWY